MKRFVTYLVSLLVLIGALALLVDYANVCLIRASIGNSAYKMERLYANPEPDEIAIVGSSRACGNFVPSLISERCFNYGVNGMGMHEAMTILEILAQRKTSAPVIVNLDPWGNFGRYFVSDYRLAPRSGRLSLTERIPGIRFFGAFRKNLVAMIDARRSVSRVVDNGALLLKTSHSAREWRVIESKMKVISFQCNPDDRLRLLSVLEAFSPRRVIVVVCPCSSARTSRLLGRRQLVELLDQIRALENVSVVDYFGSTDFSDADFVDPSHFNLKGASKFSSIFKQDLSSLLRTPLSAVK